MTLTKPFSITVLTLFLAAPALAHLEVGTYTGQSEGAVCSIQVVDTYYENNTPHPLNERARVQVAGEIFVLGHPPVVDTTQALAFFNHDVLQGVNAIAKGARAVVVEMSHVPGSEGPRAFSVLNHEWKADARSILRCESLVFTPAKR